MTDPGRALLACAFTFAVGCGSQPKKVSEGPVKEQAAGGADEVLADATRATLAILEDPNTAGAAAILERVKANEGLLASADSGDPAYDDLAIAQFGACSLLVPGKLPKSGRTPDILAIEPGFLMRAVLGQLTVGDMETLTPEQKDEAGECFIAAVLPRLATMTAPTLDAEGPFAAALDEYDKLLLQWEEALEEQLGPDTESRAPDGIRQSLRSEFGALAKLVLLQAMNQHLCALEKDGRWREFAQAYTRWLANPLTGKFARVHEMIVVRQLGLRRATELDCFTEHDHLAEELADACRRDSAKTVRDTIRKLMGPPSSAAVLRALRLILTGPDQDSKLALLRAAESKSILEPYLAHLKPEMRALSKEWDHQGRKEFLWNVWDYLWTDAAEELGHRPRLGSTVFVSDRPDEASAQMRGAWVQVWGDRDAKAPPGEPTVTLDGHAVEIDFTGVEGEVSEDGDLTFTVVVQYPGPAWARAFDGWMADGVDSLLHVIIIDDAGAVDEPSPHR